MKKKCLILVLVLVAQVFLFADSIFEYSVGYNFFIYQDTYNEVGSTDFYTYTDKGSGYDLNANVSFWKPNSSFGVDIGFSFFQPLKESVDDSDYHVGFRESERGFRIGAIHRFMINDSIILLSSFGYQILMNFDSYDNTNNELVRRTILKHGLYVQERIVYPLTDTISINGGLLAIFPLYGSDTYAVKGYDLKYSEKFAGAYVSPYLGIGLSY